jgi:hypothetical protein
MGAFLNLVGILLIIASFVISIFAEEHWVIIFPIIFALGCINLGVGKGIDILEELRNNIGK